MFGGLERYPWVVKPLYRYSSTEALIAAIDEYVIKPAEEVVAWTRRSGIVQSSTAAT
jgi:hypothetical protein